MAGYPLSVGNMGLFQYRKVNTTSANPHQLVLMLYDGAIRFVGQAKRAMDRNKLPEKGLALGKALAIVQELLSNLEEEAAPDLVANLQSLYQYLIERITYANIHNDAEVLDSVRGILDTLRDGWRQAAELLKVEDQPPSLRDVLG